jgi:hypothetical protein
MKTEEGPGAPLVDYSAARAVSFRNTLANVHESVGACLCGLMDGHAIITCSRVASNEDKEHVFILLRSTRSPGRGRAPDLSVARAPRKPLLSARPIFQTTLSVRPGVLW